MFSWLKRGATVSDRTRRMMGGRIFLLEKARHMSPVAQQIELDRLIALKDQNKHIKSLSEHPGWKELEQDIAQRCLDKLRKLPTLISEDKIEEAKTDAAYINWGNSILSIVSGALLESARVEHLINTKLSAQAQLERELQSE